MTSILGISAFYHDSAACLVVDGEIVAAAQEERFTRKKHDAGFPLNAVRYCLREGGLTVEALDYIGFYDKPLLKFDRLLRTFLDYAPQGFPSFARAMPQWLGGKLWMKHGLRVALAVAGGAENDREAERRAKAFRWRTLFGDHHESHAASAFYPSPFEEAAILTVDGVGEWATSSLGIGRSNEITLAQALSFPDSIGLLYSAFTTYAGFKVNSGEYKLMGLAPYGEPRFASLIKTKLVDIRADGSIRLNQDYFGYCHTLRMTSPAFHELFGGPPREPETQVTQKEMDLAASVQTVLDEIMVKAARHLRRETGMKRLCMAGGVALNCVANSAILRDGAFDDVWVQPAAGDAGGALGVALAIWHRYLGGPRVSPEARGTWRPAREPSDGIPPYADGMKGTYLGPGQSDEELAAFLDSRGLAYDKRDRAELPDLVAQLLADGNVIGLHQGRMEFGPRALGARSIIGDARSPKMQSVMNLKIKFRESFRPFAPSVLREDVADWFELAADSPYMLLVAGVAADRRRAITPDEEAAWGIDKLNVVRSEIPAVTHVDYSARVQTVRREMNPLYWEIIAAFRRRTGCPVIVNTSFNVRGEPITCTPEDSYRCFMRTEMDVLVLGPYVLRKDAQPEPREADRRAEFALD